jgi:drug/metabolite transporter (DMT)-like permease
MAQISKSLERERALLPAALGVAVIAISFAAIFFRLASPTHPLVSAATRMTVTALILAPFIVRAARRGALSGRLLRAALLGGLFYGIHFGAWIWSLELTAIATSVTIVTATPLLLGIAGLITGRDRPTLRLWVSIALAAVGLAILGGNDLRALAHGALAGDAMALLGAAAMAGYMLNVRRFGSAVPIMAFTGLAAAVAAVLLWSAAAASGVPLSPASPTALLYLVLAALVPQLVGHSLLTWSLRHATPTAVGIATVGEPVGATFLGWIWLGESITVPIAVGCLITLAGVANAVVSRNRDPNRSTA